MTGNNSKAPKVLPQSPEIVHLARILCSRLIAQGMFRCAQHDNASVILSAAAKQLTAKNPLKGPEPAANSTPLHILRGERACPEHSAE